ncbi:hypothetical protein J437_LFUL007205, partial [Ladona fulva]
MAASTSVAATSLPVYAQDETPIFIHRKLRETYEASFMSAKSVRKWCREFSEGRTEVHDERRSGKSSLSGEEDQIESAIREDRWFMVRELEGRFEMSKSTIQRLLNKLGCHKLCARWLPNMLTGVTNEDVVCDIKAVLDLLRWDVLTHPPTAQTWLCRTFTYEGARKEVTEYLRNKLAASFHEGIKKLAVRHEKCIQVNGDCTEN